TVPPPADHAIPSAKEPTRVSSSSPCLAASFLGGHIFHGPLRRLTRHASVQDRRNPQRGGRRPRRERQDLSGRCPGVRGWHEQTPWLREGRHRPHRLHPRRN